MPKEPLKNRKAILRSEEIMLPTIEEREFKGHVTVSLKEVPELEGVEPGSTVEIIVRGEVKDIHSNEDEDTYGIDILSFGYMDKGLSLEQAEKEAEKASS